MSFFFFLPRHRRPNQVASDGASRARRRPRSDASKAGGAGVRLLAPPPLPGATYKGAVVVVSPPTVTPPTETSPIVTPPTTPSRPPAVKPPDGRPPLIRPLSGSPTLDATGVGQEPDAVATVADPGGVGPHLGNKAIIGRGEGGGDVEDNDDDDGWGEFESA